MLSYKSPGVQAVPLLIGPKNAEAVVGVPWRWCRDWARSLGIRLVGSGKKKLIPAAAFVAALEQHRFPSVANDGTVGRAEPVPPLDAEAAILDRLGMEERVSR
jgi:hypothetical protein